ncbi:MAG: septum formation inhibitor Maf [Flavobacteriaceae bacterium]|nr:septum formation inhibitor Maf [Flavobacteriaceae bacterium]
MKSFSLLKSVFFFLLIFCTTDKKSTTDALEPKANLTQKHVKFNDYWYKGKAEITSYNLLQVRYGELHKGKAVTIFVTEDFLPEKQVKADAIDKNNIPVLKLNTTKNFVTGIYPYSLMTSTFSPVKLNQQAIKISFSSQEWCGNTFVQLNNKNRFEIDFHSYFESNADRKLSLKKVPLENHFWNLLRINPYQIKKGRYKVIPSMEYLALHHQRIRAYDAETNLIEKADFLYFSVYYPTLKRKLSIKLTKEFPFSIEGWEELFISRGKKMTTTATKIKTIQSAYWNKNRTIDKSLRDGLGL